MHLRDDASSTRDRLIAAAEVLFAERGIDGVSLREVTRRSGARNAVAIQYHFADRHGLLAAVLGRHLAGVAAGRHPMMDEFEASNSPSARALASALVRPLAAKLGEADGGPEFLQIYADVMSRDAALIGDLDSSMKRWRTLATGVLEPEALLLHRRFTAILYAAVELGRRAKAGPHQDNALFTSWLIDVIAAVLAAPVSSETRRLLGRRVVEADESV